eukprot:jgi/Bigna1/79332/fgenesh1_pg.61_\
MKKKKLEAPLKAQVDQWNEFKSQGKGRQPLKHPGGKKHRSVTSVVRSTKRSTKLKKTQVTEKFKEKLVVPTKNRRAWLPIQRVANACFWGETQGIFMTKTSTLKHYDCVVGIDGWGAASIPRNRTTERRIRKMQNGAHLLWIPIIVIGIVFIVLAADANMNVIAVSVVFSIWILCVIAHITLRILVHCHMRSSRLNLKENPEQLKWGNRIWRDLIQTIIWIRSDPTNRFRLTRALQVSVPSLMPVEAYLLDRFMGSLEDDDNIVFHMEQAFKNKNVGRIIVQALPMFDILWHNSTRMEWIRILDFLGDFAATEIQAATFGNVLNLLFRSLLGEGRWYTRYLTGNRQELTADGKAAAQNLAPANQLESVFRAQHGTHIGRIKTQKFRNANRLPTDETIVRAFFGNPAQTITDNGFEHTMRAVVKHWHFLLKNKPGNFAHQRQELLDPINAMRVSLPAILTQLVALRGINKNDRHELAPFIRRCELLEPRADFSDLRELINDFKHNLMEHVCAGVASRVSPLAAWINLILESVDRLEEEVKEVMNLVHSVRSGITFGISVVENIDWKCPTDTQFKEIIPRYLKNPKEFQHESINSRVLESALDKLNPKDKRTFIEFIDKNIPNPKSRTMFVYLNKRVRSLLKREIIRLRFNEEIQKLEEQTGQTVAGKIVAAQKAWLEFELKHLKIFGLNAFLDHAKLRRPLRDLQIVSQLQATELDESKIRSLAHMQGSLRVQKVGNLQIGKRYWFKRFYPHGKDEELQFKGYDEIKDTCCFEGRNGQKHQFSWNTRGKQSETLKNLSGEGERKCHNIPAVEKPSRIGESILKEVGLRERGIYEMRPEHYLIVGGGPTGLLTALHILGNVLSGGGTVTVSEKRGAFGDGASVFSRAQVVRLDPRWIAMLRYHLGTRFEDIFVQLDGETMAHSSNFIINQGFVELTTKTLEDVLQWGVVMRRSAGLIRYHTEAAVEYDWMKHSGKTLGHQLKVGDTLLDFIDEREMKKYEYATVIEVKDVETREYQNTKRPEALRIKVECFDRNGSTTIHCETTKTDVFHLDLRNTHFIIATGKGANAKDSVCMTTKEYYGVSCLSGSKVSHVMHRMGVQRWKNHLLNDIRSIVEDNTRLVGDFTKIISISKIAKFMIMYAQTTNWRAAACQEFGSTCIDFSTLYEELVDELTRYESESTNYLRESLQARVFETGDNTYLGMEVNREFKIWQNIICHQLSSKHLSASNHTEKELAKFKKALDRFSSKLFFQAAFDVLGSGDVFNPGAKYKIPPYNLINSHKPTTLGRLVKGDAFEFKGSLSSATAGNEQKEGSVALLRSGRYELISCGKRCWYNPCSRSAHIVRDSEGRLYRITDSQMEVYLASDFTRSPDGKTESRVAFSTFSVGHYVNTSCMRITDKKCGVVYVPVGDGQSTPHFMRYSGLTGAAINAMEINNFAEGHVCRLSFTKRYENYIFNTNWSNGEVVTRGTGFGYGKGGFLRPGFEYQAWLRYLYHKIEEHAHTTKCGTEQVVEPSCVFNYDWMRKFAAALIPRRLENNTLYQMSLVRTLKEELQRFMETVSVNNVFGDSKERMHWKRSFIEKTFLAVVDFARIEANAGQRVSSEQENQLNPLDSIADNQSPELQAFIDGFTLSASLTAAGLAAADQGGDGDGVIFLGNLGLVFQLVGPVLAFSSVSNASRYLRRNEDFQAHFVEEKLLPFKETLYLQRGKNYKVHGTSENNPFIQQIRNHMNEVERFCSLYRRPLDKNFVKKVESIWEQGTKIDQNDELHERTSLSSDDDEKESKKTYISESVATKTENVIHILLGKLIVKDYHDHTYTKDAMTSLAIALMNFRDAAAQSQRAVQGLADSIEDLLKDVEAWEPVVRAAIEEGPVHYGFCRRRSWRNNHILRILCYFRTLVPLRLGCETLSMKTKNIIRKLRTINETFPIAKNNLSFEKELRDLEEFYYASIEVNKVTLIVVAGFVAAVAGIIQFILNILNVFGVEEINGAIAGIITGVVGPVPIIIAIFFLIKQQFLMAKPNACGGNISGLLTYISEALRSIQGLQRVQETLQICSEILMWQIGINTLRIIASATAAGALLCTVAAPFLIGELALAALLSGLLALTLSLYISYGYYYYLDEKAPALVCHAFRNEIVNMYERFLCCGKTYNSMMDNRTAWAYTARMFLHKYRFDTVFDAPRLNSMFQYVQSGMDLATGNSLQAPSQLKDYESRSSGLAQGLPRRVHLEEMDREVAYDILIHGRIRPHRFVKMEGQNVWFTSLETKTMHKFSKDSVKRMMFYPQSSISRTTTEANVSAWNKSSCVVQMLDGCDEGKIR